MPRTTSSGRAHAVQAAPMTFSDAKREYAKLYPEVKLLKDRLKKMVKEQKAAAKVIYSHMEDEGLEELHVGQFTFEQREVEKCSFTEKNFKTFIENNDEDGEILERFKTQFTENTTKFKVSQKKEGTDENEE